jgi:hypothetical protein
MFPLPSDPYEARSLRSEIIFGLTFQKDSFEILHPTEKEGKKAYLWSEGNLEEPS